MKLDEKAQLKHYLILIFAVIGMVALSRKVSHSSEPIGPQVGVDITGLVILGG